MVQQNLASVQANARMLSTQGSLDLRGVYPPLPTPFTANEDVDYDKFKENVDKMNTYGFRGMVFTLRLIGSSVFLYIVNSIRFTITIIIY